MGPLGGVLTKVNGLTQCRRDATFLADSLDHAGIRKAFTVLRVPAGIVTVTHTCDACTDITSIIRFAIANVLV